MIKIRRYFRIAGGQHPNGDRNHLMDMDLFM